MQRHHRLAAEHNRPLLVMLTFGLMAVCLLGCSNGSDAARQKQTSHLRTLISFYNAAGRVQGGVPQSEEKLREYIEAEGKPVLERLEIPTVDDLFVSERDGQPFTVFYGKKPKGVRPDVVAYETTGVDGTRQVGFSLGMIQDVDETEFRELVPADAEPN